MAWSVISLVLPGCHRKYHHGLDVALDLFSWCSLTALGALTLAWAANDYDTTFCWELNEIECDSISLHLSLHEKTGAVMIIFVG